jgi:hypothetical protein
MWLEEDRIKEITKKLNQKLVFFGRFSQLTFRQWYAYLRGWGNGRVGTLLFSYSVRKMSLILRSIERMLKMQFSMARKFTLQPLRRYSVKLPKKPHKRNLMFDAPCLQKYNHHMLSANHESLVSQHTLQMRHPDTDNMSKIMGICTYFFSNFTTSLIFRINKSKAKNFKFHVNLFLIKRDNFFRANRNNFTFYTDHAGEV